MSGELKKPRTPMQLKHWLGRPPTVNVSKTIDLRVLSLRSTITIKQKKGALLRRIVMEVNMASLYSSVRKRLVSLAMTVSILTITPIAFAQDQTRTRHVFVAASNRNELELIIDNDLAISKMSLDMSKLTDPTGDVDRDFVALMVPHHQGAIDTAEPSSNTATMRSFAVWLRASSQKGLGHQR